MNIEELQSLLQSMGEPKFRARQLFSWLHGRRCGTFADMSDLPLALRGKLGESCGITTPAVQKKLVSSDGTVKLLVAFADGNCVETVGMRYDHGLSVCVSSQAGCRMGCRFCASTGAGFVRNLTPGEMLSQVYAIERETGTRADSVVLMGIGEPLDNMDAVLRFYEIVTHKEGGGLANRAVALSTCGLVPQIYELAAKGLQLTLSVSLHAADDSKRSDMMPINRRWGLSELIPACRHYFEATGRRVTFEYAVIHGQNDTPADAEALARLLRGMGAHVNLIPVNRVEGTEYRAERAHAEQFRQRLAALSINATVRRTLGADISTACGQLRREHMDNT